MQPHHLYSHATLNCNIKVKQQQQQQHISRQGPSFRTTQHQKNNSVDVAKGYSLPLTTPSNTREPQPRAPELPTTATTVPPPAAPPQGKRFEKAINTQQRLRSSPTAPVSPSPSNINALASPENNNDHNVRYVAHHILEAMRYRRRLYGLQLTDARSVFEAMDRDGDGKLSREEFEKALNRLGMGLTSSQIHALVSAVGSVDDSVPFENFLEMLGTGTVEEGATVTSAATMAAHNDGRPSHSNSRKMSPPNAFSNDAEHIARMTSDVNYRSSKDGNTETTTIRPNMHSSTTTTLHHRNVHSKVDTNNHGAVPVGVVHAAPSRRASQPPSEMTRSSAGSYTIPNTLPTATKSDKNSNKKSNKKSKHKRTATVSGDPRSGHVVINKKTSRRTEEINLQQSAIEEEGAKRGNSEWILRRNSLTTSMRTGQLEYLEKRVVPPKTPKMNVQNIPKYLGVPTEQPTYRPTSVSPSKSPEFVKVGGLYRRKTDPMKRAAAIKASLSPTVAQQVLAKQRAEASTSKRDLAAEQHRMRQNRRGSFNGVVKVEMENQKTVRSRKASFVVKSDQVRAERRKAAMAKHAREVRQREASRARLQARKSAVQRRDQKRKATNNNARQNRTPSQKVEGRWNTGTKVRKKNNMISTPSGDAAVSVFDIQSQVNESGKERSRKRKNNNNNNDHYSDEHNTYVPYVPGSERTVTRKQSEAASTLINVLDARGVPRNAHPDVIESIRASFEGFDSRGTGMVGVGDVRQSLIRLELIDETEADQICGVVRTDRDGFVHYPEFLVALRAATKNSTAPMQLFSPTVVHKVRTDHERAADKHKLAAMKETLVLNEQAAKEEIRRIENDQLVKIKELHHQHEDVKKKMKENAKLEAELVQQEAKDARSAEVRGLWGKHRGTVLDKGKAAREARKQQRILDEQQRYLEILMADIEEEKKKVFKKRKKQSTHLPKN